MLDQIQNTAPTGGDPISAIAGAVGQLFGTFTQIGSTRQTGIQSQTDLLLASQPRRPVQQNFELWFLVAMIVLLLIVVFFKLFK
jgi:hypothetical protein